MSEDSGLYDLCAGILKEVSQDQPWSLVIGAGEDAGDVSDLYVWDFEPTVKLSEHISCNRGNLIVLARRSDVADVQKVFGFEPHIVLKPVTRAALSVLISLAVSKRATNSLRDDRDQILQSLIEANLKLQEYDRDRTNFLTRIVHDFRAPLMALNGYCGLLLGDALGSLNEKQQEVMGRMQYSTKRLSRMVAAMLQLTTDRETKRGPELQMGDLGKTLDQALQEVEYLAREKNLSIKRTLESTNGELYFDHVQIDQVLVNILDNACKFSPRNGSIEIRGYPFFWERRVGPTPITTAPTERRSCDVKGPNSYRIDISDSGQAISANHLGSIFEEYTSYAGGKDRSGGGLGLAICRTIIDQHRGRIWAENSDKGPMFCLVLPVRRRARAQSSQNLLSA